MKIRYLVVTRVPSPEEAGNMAWVMPYVQVEAPAATNGWMGKLMAAPQAFPGSDPTIWRAPVFALGEVLIVGADGRELAGHGRKPDKWDVSVEEFELVTQAIGRAQEVQAA